MQPNDSLVIPMTSERKIFLVGGADDEFGMLTAGPRDNKCFIRFSHRGRTVEEGAADYFEALCQIRLKLEQEKLIPFCYGASLNVYPSGMARDMGAGLKAYRLTLGKKAGKDSLVEIFAEGPDVVPAYVSRQREYFQEWLNGPKA